MGPFNSQNTFLKGSLLKDYFMFPHIGRMDDIWAAYYLQALGAGLSGPRRRFINPATSTIPSATCRRYSGYENNLELVEKVAKDPEAIIRYLPGRSADAFRLCRKHFK